MTVASFFILSASDNSLVKKFRVLYSGYKPTKTKSESVKRTVDGYFDITQGGIYRAHDYVIRLHAEETDDEYGTLDDLDTFYSFNNPNPVSGPSNLLKMTLHNGEQWVVMTQGEFTPEPVGAMVDGPDALFFLRMAFLFIGPLEGS